MPGLAALWVVLLGISFALLPQPWQVRRPPVRRASSREGQRWLRQQQAVRSRAAATVYVLWSEAEWAARSAALPSRSQRFLSRGPV